MNEVAPRWDPKAPWALPSPTRRRALLVVCGLGLAVSYLLTWDLWLPRLQPPNLPAVDGFRSVGYGVPLLLAAFAAPAFPRVGATLHTGLFVLAVLGDQVRLQPEFVSLAILLLGAAWPTTGLSITRWHLVALWGWAGFHKVLSGGWPTGGASFIATALGAPGVRTLIAVVVPVLEVGLALLAVKPRTWKVLRWAAPAFHLGVLVPLVVTEWNTAVWPWNLCLAAAAPLLFSKSVEDRTEGCILKPRARISVAAVAAFLVVHPTGFYFGVTDAYLAHNLYSSNTAEASICSSASRSGSVDLHPSRPGKS